MIKKFKSTFAACIAGKDLFYLITWFFEEYYYLSKYLKKLFFIQVKLCQQEI